MEVIILILVLMIVITECGAMSCIRMSGIGNGHLIYFIYGMLLYILVAILLRKSFNIRGMAVVNTLWSALSVITVAGIGYLYFGEQLTHWEVIAVGLASIAAGIMARDK